MQKQNEIVLWLLTKQEKVKRADIFFFNIPNQYIVNGKYPGK